MSNNEKPKVLGLDALTYIKEYIDRVNINTNSRIDVELKNHIEDRITTAVTQINNDYTTKYNDLIDRIAAAEQANNTELLLQLKLQLSTLQGDTAQKFDALEALAEDLARLSGNYDSLYEGITTGSVFTAGQLDEIINTALINKTRITDDMIETPNLYTSNIVALIAKFGSVKAANIDAGTIKGSSIESLHTVTGTNDPVWKIDNEGDGWLAKKNISWDRDGNVTFGDNVRISFNQVDGAEDKLNDMLHDYDDTLQGYVKDFIQSGVKGTSIFTSIVFARAGEKPATPTGGDYYRPVPDESIWTDYIPTGNNILWSSSRVFASSADANQQDAWSDPVQMTDSKTFDVEFSSVVDNPGNPTDNPDNWSNDGDYTTVWMATRTIDNGIPSAWQVMKVKGENGKDGTSINIKGSYNSIEDFKAAIAGDDLATAPNNLNDCYIVAGDLYIWDSTRWINVGRFTGHDAVSRFKSTVFKRSNEELTEAPSGGSWDNPKPDDNTWSDGIPSGTGKVWMSTREFYSDEATNALYTWSVPSLMIDTESFEVAYGSVEVTNYNPISVGLPKLSGKANPSGTYEYGWTDEPEDGVEYHYMATAKCDNGDWSTWTVSKIKGEDGKDGTSVSIAGEFPSEEALNTAFPNGPTPITSAYVVNGYLYVWSVNKWRNVGQFLGKDGKDGEDGKDGTNGINGESAYLYMVYAKNIDFDDNGNITNIVLTADNGESTDDAKWLGLGHGNTAEEPYPVPGDNVYKWTKIYVDPIVVPAKFKSIVFTRQNVDISDYTPVGGSWNDPKPSDAVYNGVGIVWSDGIPAGDSGIIWSTTRTFESDEDFSRTIYWPNPVKMVDTPEFETAYGDASVANTDGTANESGLPKKNGKANPDAGYTFGWTDEPTAGVEYHYMATATKKDGEWSAWSIFKIKGEKGDKGAGIKYKNTLLTISDLDLVTPPDSEEDAYIIKTNPEDSNDNQWNHLFAWTGLHLDDDKYNSIDGFYKGWSDTGKFNGSDGKDGKDGKDGEDGLTTYVYIKYADHIEYNEDGTLNYSMCIPSKNSGEMKGRWMGLGNGTDPNDPVIDAGVTGYVDINWDKYKWTELVDQSRIDNAVVTEFGKYDIKANLIKGKTVQSTTEKALANGTNVESFDEEGLSNGIAAQSNGPAWQLRNDGAGYLAAGNIRWDESGNVELSKDVKLKWEQVEDGATTLSDAINTSSTSLRNEITASIDAYKQENTAALSEILAKQAQAQNNIADAQAELQTTKQLLNDSNASNETKFNALSNTIANTKSAIESKYDVAVSNINTNIDAANSALDAAKTELNNAITSGKEEAIAAAQAKVDALNATIDSLNAKQTELETNYNNQSAALSTLSSRVEELSKDIDSAGLSEEDVASLIETAFINGTYIDENSVSSENVFAQKVTSLIANFGTVKAGNVTSGVLQGSTVQSNVSIDDSGVDATGTVINPTWKIDNDGTGYLAKKNIQWNENGDLTVKSVNGTVTIGEGVGVGPWNTFEEDGVSYIGDKESFSSSTNVFGSDGTFKVGGSQGIVKNTTDGDINLGSKVVFSNGSDEDSESESTKELHWRIKSEPIGNANAEYSFIYIGKNLLTACASNGSQTTMGELHVYIYEDHYKHFINTGKVGTPSNVVNGSPTYILYSNSDPENLKLAIENGNEYGSTVSYTVQQPLSNQGAESYYQFFINGNVSVEHFVTSVEQVDLNPTVTRDDLTSWWDKTTIDAGKITTGSISADVIDVNNLSVKRLNTTGKGTVDKGTIKVENNDLTVYSNSVSGKAVLKITGDSLEKLPDAPSEFSVGKYLGGYRTEYLFGQDVKPSGGWAVSSMRVLPYVDLQIGSFEVPDDATYKLSKYGTNSFELYFDCQRSNQSSAGPSIYAYAQTYIIPKGSNIPDGPFEGIEDIIYNREEHRIDLYRDYDGSLRQQYSLYGNDLYFEEIAITDGKSITISAGEYEIRCRFMIDNSGVTSQYDDIRITSVKYAHYDCAKITPSSEDVDMSRVDISSYGFRYFVDTERYVTFTKGGDFIIKNGNNALKWDTAGKMYFVIGGMQYPIGMSEITYKITASRKGTTKFLTLGEPSEFDDKT